MTKLMGSTETTIESPQDINTKPNGPENEPGSVSRTVRLNVKLNEQTAADLKRVAARKEISATEAIRRAVAIWTFVEDTYDQGHKLLLVEGNRTKELVYF